MTIRLSAALVLLLATPALAGWSSTLEGVEIPDSPVEGSIHGKVFRVDRAKLENGILTLRQGADFFADLEINVFLFLSQGEVADGKNYECPSFDAMGGPHVWKKWKPEGQDMPEQQGYMKDFVMRLEFGTREGTKLPGRLYLAIDDAEKTWIAGAFEAEVPPPPEAVERNVDATKDSFRTLQGLARQRLEEEGASIEVVDYDTTYYLPVAPRQTGTCRVVYRAGGALKAVLFEFAKEEGTWRITGSKEVEPEGR